MLPADPKHTSHTGAEQHLQSSPELGALWSSPELSRALQSCVELSGGSPAALWSSPELSRALWSSRKNLELPGALGALRRSPELAGALQALWSSPRAL
eukprot:985243-Alexandrium_andersonii.AAC.1